MTRTSRRRRSATARAGRCSSPPSSSAGFRIDASEAGLYLWATEGRDAWESLARLADLGILAGPGHFYGTHFPQHVRLSLTATDERDRRGGRAAAAPRS